MPPSTSSSTPPRKATARTSTRSWPRGGAHWSRSSPSSSTPGSRFPSPSTPRGRTARRRREGDAPTSPGVLSVREMPPEMVGLRIDYFHDATDEELVRMGVERSLLPSREDWRRSYAQDVALPLPQRKGYVLVWELDAEPVGFSTL